MHLISGSAPRSEWKFDLIMRNQHQLMVSLNVTGEVKIIPGGTSGGVLPKDGVISIIDS